MVKKYYKISLLLMLLLFGFTSPAQTDIPPMKNPVITHYPFTQEYFEGFMDSEEEFTMIYFNYFMRSNSSHPDARWQRLDVEARYRYNGGTLLNFPLSEIDEFYSYYIDIDINQSYEHKIPSNLVIPMFQVILDNGNYFFNAEEFNGEETLEYGSITELGLQNRIIMQIYLPNQEQPELPTKRTFIKDWNIGDDPPEELMPLIDYLEDVILPEMRQHPYP